MDRKTLLKERWRKLKIIRPAFWWLYRQRPSALVTRAYAWYCMKRRYPALYKKGARRPVDEKKALLIEIRYSALSDNLALLYQRMKADPAFRVQTVCLNSSQKSRLQVYRDMASLVKACADAKYLFITDGCDVLGTLPLRPETVYVQTWHACGAFKRFGMSTGDLYFGDTRKKQEKYPVYGNVNFVTVSAEEVRWAYAEAMHRPLEYIRPVGVSRTDLFFDPDARQRAFETLYQQFPAARGRKVILFAPTFRGHVSDAVTNDRLQPSLFAEALGEEYVLVIKHHPLVKKIPPVPEKLRGSFAYDATKTMSIEDLIFTADICITDYSSLIFEYALMQRPMLFFAYDLEEYYDWRGFYYPFEEMTPGPVCRTNEEMIDYILHLQERFDPQEVENFRNRFMSACDGHATERIITKVLEEGRRRSKREADHRA